MSEELKPCPFCGGTAKLAEFTYKKYSPYIYPHYKEYKEYRVYCRKCQARQFGHIYKKNAVKAWNKRIKNND